MTLFYLKKKFLKYLFYIAFIDILLTHVSYAIYFSYQIYASKDKNLVQKFYKKLPSELKPYAFIYKTNSNFFIIRVCLASSPRNLKVCEDILKKYSFSYKIVPCSAKKIKSIFNYLPQNLLINLKNLKNKNISSQNLHKKLKKFDSKRKLEIYYLKKKIIAKNLLKNNIKFQGYVHYPFKKGKCLICHRVHISKYIYLLKFNNLSLKANEVCLSCHKKNYCKQKGICLSCHNPHFSFSSRFRFRKYIHDPFKKQNCQVCHTNISNINDVCLSCHKNKTNPQAPFSGLEFLKCYQCHDPHGNDNKYRLNFSQVENLCIKCHRKILQFYENLHYKGHYNKVYKGRKITCSDCHNIHAGPNYNLLKYGEIKTCIKCHKGCSHPMGIPDPRNGSPITCVTCHNPMGSRYKYYLRYNGKRNLCVQCHKKRG